MIPVFILGYRGIDYFDKWFVSSNYSETTNFYIVDNGSQTFPDKLQDMNLYTTSRNIGCAGGWNLICHIAFDHMNLDKIIIAQEDGMFTQTMLHNIWMNTTSDVLVGGYNRSFEFALFGIHRDLYSEVGEFDENFIFGGCEDNDYKHRMKLTGKQLLQMNYDADLNCSLSVKREADVLAKTGVYNGIYIQMKWGKNYEFVYPFNDPQMNKDNIPIQQGLIDVYGDVNEYPSKTEYSAFVAENNS